MQQSTPAPEPAPARRETAPTHQIAPIEVPMVPFALGGMAAWACAGLVLLLFRNRLAAHGHSDWLWICLAGFLLGIPGLLTMIWHDARVRRRRADQPQP